MVKRLTSLNIEEKEKKVYKFVGTFQHALQRAAIVTLSLQTDFAARLDEVKEFAKFLAQMAVGFQVKTA